MTAFEKYPELKGIFDDCYKRVTAITGDDVEVIFKLRFKHITINQLATIVCHICEVSWEQVVNQDRKIGVVMARHIFCYYANTWLKKSLVVISNALKRDHTTVIHGRDKIKSMIDVKDDMYYPIIMEVEKQLNELMA